MSKALPFTVASLARAIKGVGRAGLYVVGIRPDGTLLIACQPLDLASLAPPAAQDNPTVVSRRFGEKIHGGDGAA